MPKTEHTIDFATPSQGSASFGLARGATSTSVALDQLDLRLDLKEVPDGPIDIVLHTTAGQAGELGLAVAVNGKGVERCGLQSAHRLSIPHEGLRKGENTIRLSRVPLFVSRITADVPSSEAGTNVPSTAPHPLDFGLQPPTDTD